MTKHWSLLFVPLALFAAGCPVFQSQDVPVSALRRTEPKTGRLYRLYVPSYHTTDRDWPLLITLHGTYGFESSRLQIKEWQHLAEEKGFIVAAPDLRSVQGILPVNRKLWYADLDSDERAVLAMREELVGQYNVDPNSVLLSGFSAGGYPMYHIALKHPEKFQMLVARACNCTVDILERIELSDEARKLPIRIFWGKDDLKPIADQSWMAIRWLSERGFEDIDWGKIKGGHLRRPDVAYGYWRKVMAKRHAR